jgi:hypothetical protein
LRYTEKPPAEAAAGASKSKKKSADKDKEEEEVRRGRHAALDSLLRMGQAAAAGGQSEQTEKLVVTLEVEILDDGEYKQFTQIGVALTTRRLNKQVSRQQVLYDYCTYPLVVIILVFKILASSRSRFSQAVTIVFKETHAPRLFIGVGPYQAVLRIRIHMFLGLLDPDPLVRGMDPNLSIIKRK